MVGLLSFVLAACDNQSNTGSDTGQDTLVEQSQAGRQDSQAQGKRVTLEEVWATEQVLEVPESVYYNADEDVLYVSNIAGEPAEKNGQGYISRLSPDGELLEQKWVTGLHAPKGMGMMNGKLYVADVDRLVEIDVKQGQVSNTYQVKGATFLNDVAVTDDNKVLFSDSNEGKIHVFENGRVQVWNEEELDRPNGLLADGGRVLLASSGSNDVKEILEGASGEVMVEGIGAGDGLVALGEGAYLVSNWQGEVYYIGDNIEKQKLLDTKEQNINSADIEYIQERNLLLVPTFRDKRVVAYRLNRTL